MRRRLCTFINYPRLTHSLMYLSYSSSRSAVVQAILLGYASPRLPFTNILTADLANQLVEANYSQLEYAPISFGRGPRPVPSSLLASICSLHTLSVSVGRSVSIVAPFSQAC